MAQCRYHTRPDGDRCVQDATAVLEGVMRFGDIDSADLCEDHRREYLEGWERMQGDAAALRDKGFEGATLNQLMCGRVERRAYDREPSEVELHIRVLEERAASEARSDLDPQFVELAIGMLHIMIRQAAGDSPEADALREALGDVMKKLTLEDRQRLNNLSGRCYEMTDHELLQMHRSLAYR